MSSSYSANLFYLLNKYILIISSLKILNQHYNLPFVKNSNTTSF